MNMNRPYCAVEGHGPLIDIEGRLWCPHQSHDGRPPSHPDGPAPATNAWADAPEPVEARPIARTRRTR